MEIMQTQMFEQANFAKKSQDTWQQNIIIYEVVSQQIDRSRKKVG